MDRDGTTVVARNNDIAADERPRGNDALMAGVYYAEEIMPDK